MRTERNDIKSDIILIFCSSWGIIVLLLSQFLSEYQKITETVKNQKKAAIKLNFKCPREHIMTS